MTKAEKKRVCQFGTKSSLWLLHGPPGCAKTTLAGAAAGSVEVADLYSLSYVGEAEAVVRCVFSLTRSAAPCILFFDKIDMIVGTSNNANTSGMNRGTNEEVLHEEK